MRRVAAAREQGPPCTIASSQRIECAAVYDGARVGRRTAQIPSASCAAMSLADTVALDQLVRAVRMRIAAA